MTDTIAPPGRRDNSRHTPHGDRHRFNEAATALILEHGATILQDARRYTRCSADAEDAYQRSLEILLTKAPSDDLLQLLPWVRTVTKNEAIAIAKQRNRVIPTDTDDLHAAVVSDDVSPEEWAESEFESDVSLDALRRLKPDEVRCLLIQADGGSYDDIARITGFSARKVTRCVIEGRRAFRDRFDEIESGAECELIEPLLHRIVDRDAEAQREAQAHLAHCVACRGTLKAYASAPTRVASLFPVGLVAIVDGDPTRAWQGLTEIWHSIWERLMVHTQSVQQWAEVSSVKKVATVVAVSSAVTAGGAGVSEVTRDHSLPVETDAHEPRDRERPDSTEPAGPAPAPADAVPPAADHDSSLVRERVGAEDIPAVQELAPESAGDPVSTPDPSPVPAPKPSSTPVQNGVGDLAP